MSGSDRDEYDTYWGVKGDHCRARRWWIFRCRLNRHHGGNHLWTQGTSGFGKEVQW